MSFEPDGVSRKEYDRLIAQVADLTKLRLEDELVHCNVMGRLAIALFGDQNNRTDEECVARAAEIGYELSGAKQRAERAEAELAAAQKEIEKLQVHNARVVQAIHRIHECIRGEWVGSESEIADVINDALAEGE